MAFQNHNHGSVKDKSVGLPGVYLRAENPMIRAVEHSDVNS